MCEVKDEERSDEARRRSDEERLGYEESELRDVVDEDAVEFGWGYEAEGLVGCRCGMGNGEGDGGRRSDMPSLCSELRVGI